MDTKSSYKRLDQTDRIRIETLLKSGASITEISTILRRSYSSVYRELQRCKKGKYKWQTALALAENRSSSRRYNKTKINRESSLRNYIYTCLEKRWSPEQIMLKLKKEYPNNPKMQITMESIYYHIYMHSAPGIREMLISQLRQKRIVRGNVRRGKDKRSTIVDRTMIDERPAEVDSREIPGHWEGDLILGKNRESAIGTIVERSTRALIIVPLKSRDATTVRKEFAKELRKLPLLMRKSLTYDNGTEMAQHKLLAKHTKMKVYFTHPYSPWERPTNENFNGLIRDYFPKGTDFNKISRKRLKQVQDELNERPRKVLQMSSPQEVFDKMILSQL